MSDELDIDVQLLPEKLRKIVARIGITPTMALVRRYGGTRLYVPKMMTEDHSLAQLLGYENAVALSGEYGGDEHFDIPKAERALMFVRDRRIVGARGHRSARDLAIEHRLTERGVYKILARTAVEDRDAQIASEQQPKLI